MEVVGNVETMDKHTKDILLKFDEVNRYETPSNFDYDQLKSHVADLVHKLEGIFNLEFVIDDQIQDASFFCDIRIPTALLATPKTNTGYSIRISNFGSLATLTFDEEYPEDVKRKLKDTLARKNFVFIQSDDLEEVYDGAFTKFYEILGRPRPSWRTRYFDYL